MRRTLLAALLLAAPLTARATDVQGNLNVDTRWDLAGSPYRLIGDVTVRPQATLTIEPGVVVEAANSDSLGSGTSAAKVELIVQGALQANGTAASPVIFRGSSAANDAWYGISLEPAARASSITNAELRNAQYGLWSRAASVTTLSDLRIVTVGTGVLWQSATALLLERATIEGATGHGLELQDDGATGLVATVRACTLRDAVGAGVRLSARVTATIDRSTLARNAQYGVDAPAGSSLVLRSSVVAGNRVAGARLEQTGAAAFSIVNNTIDTNELDPIAASSAGTGLLVLAVSNAPTFVIRNNLVTNHGSYGVDVVGPTQPSLDHNDVWNNGTNYRGATAGVGSVSTNPLYVQPLGGSGAWTFVSSPIVQGFTGHGVTLQWTYTQPGAVAMRAIVTALSTEGCCDILRFYDAANNQIAAFSGSTTGTTPFASGDTLRMTFTTDGSVNSAGFTISGYEYQLPGFNYRLQPSSPVIDLGNALDAPLTDLDGAARPYDGDVNGQADFDLGAYEWHENIAPLAIAGADRLVLPGTSIDFDATASRDPDGSITAYAWDFGDGTTAITPTASHSYAAVGVYTVTLTVTDDQSVTGTDTATVTVTNNLPPVAAAGNDQFVDVGAQASFDGGASTDADGVIVGYSWSFGDGAPLGTGRTVTHSYAGAGVYTVTLTVTDDRGATATDTTAVVVGQGGGGNQTPVADAGLPQTIALGAQASLDGRGSTDGDGTLASYAWDFGDGLTGSGAQVTHLYAAAGAFVVTLTVTDDDGAIDTDTTLVTVQAPPNALPVARAGGPYAASVGQSVQFDGSASSDADGPLASYAWDFGDAQSGGGAITTHTYAAAGTFLARLTVTDAAGATDEASVLVTISAPDNDPPLADAGGNRNAAVAESLLFDGTGSSDPDGSIVAWAWDFGDGSTGAGAQASHGYGAAGTYLVRLTVTDDDGAIGQDVALVTVGGAGNRAPIADAGSNRSAGIDENVLFDASASFDADGSIVAYAWDFGDDAAGAGAQATHAFAAAGAYLVKLTVTDDLGATGEDFVLVTVGGGGGTNQSPLAVAGADVAGDVGEALAFNASSSVDPDGSLIAYQWDFGDGGTAAGLSATHVYAASGTFTVTLTVIDDQAARATDTLVATINALPIADAGPARAGVVGEALSFDGGGSEDSDGTIASYAWDFGDGTRADGQQATHAWASAGTYTLTLRVTDDAGARGEATAVVVITEAGGDGGSGGGAGGGGTPDGGGDAAAAEDGGGCGCAAGGAGSPAGLLLFGLAAVLLRRRR